MHSDRREITHPPQSVYYATSPAPDEITLIDLWLVLMRRRWWVVGTLIVVMGTVTAFLVLSRPLYESRATIQIGQIANVNGSGQTTMVESPDALVAKLQAEYDLGEKDTAPRKLPKITKVKATGSSGLVTITARGYSPNQVQSFLVNAIQKIQRHLQKRFDRAMGTYKSYLASLKRQQRELQSQADSISRQLAKAAASDQNITSTLTTNRAGLLQQIGTIQAQIANVQQSMAPPQSMRTELVQQPTLPIKRAFPKVKLTLLLGLTGGMIFGLLVAFSVEFVHSASAEVKLRRGETGDK